MTESKAHKFSFSRKFYEEFGDSNPLLPVVNKTDRFIAFIMAAQVPARMEDTRGNTYATNKYSVEAEKIFNKMIDQDGVDYDLLVKSTMLYYKSGIRLKKAIGNYITYGDWKTDYEALKLAASTGTEELNSHISNERKDGSYSAFIF